MIGIRPIKEVKRARKGTINNVNSRCIKQVSVFTAILLSHNIPASKLRLRVLWCRYSAAPSPLWGAGGEKMFKLRNVTGGCQSRACVMEKNGERNFQCWWELRRTCEDGRSSVSC